MHTPWLAASASISLSSRVTMSASSWLIAGTITCFAVVLGLNGCSEPASSTASEKPEAAAESLVPVADAVPVLQSPAPLAEVDPPPSDEPPGEPFADVSPVVNLESDPTSRQLLRWTLSAGDMLRYMATLTEQVTNGRLTFENQRQFTYVWHVVDVSDEGFATLVVTFERLRLNLAYPPLFFDSLSAEALKASLNDARVAEELVVARQLLGTQIVVEMAASGQITHIVGDRINAGCEFLPADFPIFTAEAVGPLDSWRMPVVSLSEPRRVVQKKECKFKKVQDIGERKILVLTGQTESAAEEAAQRGTFSDPRVATTTARFDADRGRFLSCVTVHRFESQLPDGERQEIVQKFTVQLLPGRRGPVER